MSNNPGDYDEEEEEDYDESSEENYAEDYDDNFFEDDDDNATDNPPAASSSASHTNPTVSQAQLNDLADHQFFSLVSHRELQLAQQLERSPAGGGKEQPCSICLCEFEPNTRDTVQDEQVVSLKLCSHMFHRGCIETAFKTKLQCPLCLTWYAASFGNQPFNATMHISHTQGQVPGHSDANGFHVISYNVPSGVQTQAHLRPGQRYHGTTRVAYLPNNEEGTIVLKLLQLAFDRLLIFTVGDSVTSGARNVVTWNCIHHKTSMSGGPSSYGYPDPEYLNRVQEELASVGIHRGLLN